MNRWINNAKLAVLGLFLLASAGAAYYDWAFVWPVKRCDEQGAWWDRRDRQCLTPIPIWRLTGRGLTAPPPVDSAPAASQRVAAGTQSTSSAPPPLATRAATNSRSDSRLR